MEILNVEEFINADIPEKNKDELVNILEEFKLGHYLNVLSKTSDLREKMILAVSSNENSR
ncbi:hypothetical protein ACFO3D_01520 [Virgibacillus kekensis]|uniref:Uncharacterized protein n=1 Tax=Virgibacillus kekensis TaxID=202261 RepID=A0ABV9DF49_9BACI